MKTYKHFRLLTISDIMSRKPFYIKCSKCGAEIEAYERIDVKVKAKTNGWGYDCVDNVVLCSICLQKEREDYYNEE